MTNSSPSQHLFAEVLARVHAVCTALAGDGVLPAGLDLSRIVVEPPRDASHGDMATNAAMVLAKDAKAKPRDLADQIATRLRADPLGMALVMDEYGSFEGVVTASDMLQAIVGDPADTAPQVGGAASAEGAALTLDGMMAVDEVKARLDLPDLPAPGSYHTLAGLLLALLRRVPRVGDRIVFAGWRFEVLAMDGRRVDKVRAGPEPAAEAP